MMIDENAKEMICVRMDLLNALSEGSGHGVD
jgi:hypothetical protein